MLRSVSASPLLTAADVERMSIPDKQVELVRGRLVIREPERVPTHSAGLAICSPRGMGEPHDSAPGFNGI